MKSIFYISTFNFILLTILLWRCSSIHENPNEHAIDPTRIQVNLHITPASELTPYPTLPNKSSSSYNKRFIIEIYNKQSFDKSLETRRIIYRSIDDTTEFTTTFDLHATRYQIAVWQDYVACDTYADKYYTTDNFALIRITEPHLGCDDRKDASACVDELDLTNYRNQWNISLDHELALIRPLAKIELITTDIGKYIDKVRDTKAIDLSTFRATVFYSGYYPTGFNVYTDKPNDSRTGIQFDAPFELLSANEGRVGYDYVFVNGKESAVTVDIIIYDATNKEINRVGNITVPIKRNKITTVKGEFLTLDYAPDIGIDPDFEGEINVVIPD